MCESDGYTMLDYDAASCKRMLRTTFITPDSYVGLQLPTLATLVRPTGLNPMHFKNLKCNEYKYNQQKDTLIFCLTTLLVRGSSELQ